MTKQTKQHSVALYSLGLEELAMGLGLINRPDMGRDLLKAAYEKITDVQVDARLSSATHSLLARGLCAISPQGVPILSKDLEQALFPLARFDHALQLSIVHKTGNTNATIHIRKSQSFTSHVVELGVIHVLEHGKIKDLVAYLQDVFEGFAADSDYKEARMIGKITPGLLGRILQTEAYSVIRDELNQRGWQESDVKHLAEDTANQIMRATLLRIEANSQASYEDLKDVEKKSLLLLQSEQRAWLFEFNASGDDTEGTAQLVNRTAFNKALANFLL